MRRVDGHYEYIVRYVDDLCIISKDPATIISLLKDKYNLKLKGSGPIEYYLGCNYFRDTNGILCMSPKKYIDRMMEIYERLFGSKPKQVYSSPLEPGDHPELDISTELGIDDTKKYQSLIGALQWLILLGCFDIATAVMSLSSFRAAPKEGHLQRVCRIFGYVSKMRHACIRFRTDLPDYSDIPIIQYGWSKTIYGNVTELVPQDCYPI